MKKENELIRKKYYVSPKIEVYKVALENIIAHSITPKIGQSVLVEDFEPGNSGNPIEKEDMLWF
ncbi:MAG: hypothetical protein LBH19_00670 [Dysgonamonadaceae bacterium]|jgi:hypothetical protein|nr:hypothetical protein [Dysgonamonadaceae bacterium]